MVVPREVELSNSGNLTTDLGCTCEVGVTFVRLNTSGVRREPGNTGAAGAQEAVAAMCLLSRWPRNC